MASRSDSLRLVQRNDGDEICLDVQVVAGPDVGIAGRSCLIGHLGKVQTAVRRHLAAEMAAAAAALVRLTRLSQRFTTVSLPGGEPCWAQ